MEWWQTLLMTAGTCLITLLVTFIFNQIVNRPAKKKKEKKDEENRLDERLKVIKQGLQDSVDKLKEEVIEERKGCKSDHCSLVKLVYEIQTNIKKNQVKMDKANLIQNAGLQSVLRDLLKIRYLEWLDKGYTTIDAKDDLERMYEAYHGLGGNSTITTLRDKFIKLPLKEEIKSIKRDVKN